MRVTACFAILAALSPRAAAQDTTPQSRDSAEVKVAELTNQLDATIVVGEWGENTTVEKVLAEIAARLPAAHPIPIEIDRAAFGPDLPKFLAAPVRLTVYGERSVRDVLRDALRQVPRPAEADYALRPTGVVITRPPFAVRAATYEVRDLVRLPPGTLARWATDGEPAADSAGPPMALVHLLLTHVDLRPWETVRLVNQARLEVTATPGRHDDIDRLLESLRRMADLHVYMNARIYEVSRAFYTAAVAPLVAPKDGADTTPVVVRVDGPLLKKLTRQPLIQEGDETKLRPYREAAFLSRQTAFRYAAGPGERPGSGLAGVSFAVRPEVSPDRRYLRLHLTQEVADLVAIDKGTALDPRTGQAVEVEVPNIRKTTVSGTVQIEDGGPFLMPVRYRPPGEGGDGKVWLLVARPMIWIEAEARERGPTFTPRSTWDWEVRRERVPRIDRLPATDDVKEVLQAVLTDVLTNPKLKGTRESYGSDKQRTLVLSAGGKVGWPEGFRPDTHGYTVVPAKGDPFIRRRGVLAVRLDKFDLKQTEAKFFDAPIDVCLLNADGQVLGGLSVGYLPKRVGKRWTVELTYTER